MGSKKNRNRAAPTPVAEPPSNGAPWPLIAVVAVALAGGGIYMATSSSSSGDTDETQTASAQMATETAALAAPSSTTAAPGAAAPAAAEPTTTAARTPLPDDLPMPPLPYVPRAAAGPPELMQQAYVFAAKNPHILDYVPCYCGCGQTDGHIGNTDCFVDRRAPNGAVEAWDTHGMT